jgi:hypothetical protein
MKHKPNDDDLTWYSNTGGPPLRPACFLFPCGKPVYFIWGKYAVNLGSGWLRVDLDFKPWEKQ